MQEPFPSVEATNIEPMDTIDHSITSDISGLEEKKKPKKRKRKYKKASELMEGNYTIIQDTHSYIIYTFTCTWTCKQGKCFYSNVHVQYEFVHVHVCV